MTDAVSVIMAALSAAFASGSQAALSDMTKEAIEYLKKRVLQAFSGQQKALMVLDSYEHDPETWEKPLKDLLIKAGLPQDEAAVNLARRVLDLTGSQPSKRDHMHIQHFGTGQGAVYGTNYGTINVNPSENKVVKGKVAFVRGKEALWRREYDLARRALEDASQHLAEGQLRIEGAQIRYFQALALLNGKRPSSAPYQILRRIEQLLQAAIALHPCRSYLYTLALVKYDYARHGFPHFVDEAQALFEQMRLTSASAQDQENLQLLTHCQPRLLQDAQNWWEDDQRLA